MLRGIGGRAMGLVAPESRHDNRYGDAAAPVQNITLLQNIGVMIVAAAVVLLVLKRLSMPSIVLFILTGLALGLFPGLLSSATTEGTAADAHAHSPLEVITHVGIALLLFLVGLELSFDRIRDVGKVAVLAGIGQVVFTAVIGFGFAMMLGFEVMASVFIATALTFSSTVVVVKLLDQKKQLQSLYGRIAVGIFLVQDLVVIVALTFLAGLGGEGQSMTFGAMAWSLTKAFLGMGLLLLVAVLASRHLLGGPVSWAARSAETLFVWALFWCFAFVVAAEVMDLSPEIGAFLAGISLAQLPASHDLRRRIHPLMSFFIALFFISLGAQMDLRAAVDQWFSALLLSLFVLIGNPLIFMFIIARSGYSERTSFMTSVTVAQISEFSFIFILLGVQQGWVDENVQSLVAVVGLVTISVSAYMILYNEQLYQLVKKLGLLRPFSAGQQDEDETKKELHDHIIIVGMNALGRRLAQDLHAKGHRVLAVDTDNQKLADLPCRTMQGNIEYPMVMDEAGLEHAKLVVSALQIEDTNNLLAYHCKQHGIRSAIHAFDRSVIAELKSLGVDYLIEPRVAGSVMLAVELEKSGVMAP